MREAILDAIASGTIEALKSAIELNELPPDVGRAPNVGQGRREDPITALKRQSADGSGRDVLDVLGRLLATDAALVPLGRDIENNGVYVWPYLAERDLSKLSKVDRAALDALVGQDAAAEIVRSGRWTWWRVAIGADGTWHAFARGK
jgi:hypothetical protein